MRGSNLADDFAVTATREPCNLPHERKVLARVQVSIIQGQPSTLNRKQRVLTSSKQTAFYSHSRTTMKEDTTGS